MTEMLKVCDWAPCWTQVVNKHHIKKRKDGYECHSRYGMGRDYSFGAKGERINYIRDFYLTSEWNM